MDYMYNACSTTARRGALDWAKEFEKVNLPVFERLYESVKNGTETRRSLEFNGRATYREDLAKELKEIDEQEIWRAGVFHSFFRRRYLYAQTMRRQGRPFSPAGQAIINGWLALCRAEHTQKHLRGAPLDLCCSASILELMSFKPIPTFECLRKACSVGSNT